MIFGTDDGLCFFDIYTENESVTDMARMVDLRLAASHLIGECINGLGHSVGGIAEGLGLYFSLH